MTSRIAFAAVNDRTGFLWAASCRSMASESRAFVGEAYSQDGENWRAGWERAKNDGYRIRRVNIWVVR